MIVGAWVVGAVVAAAAAPVAPPATPSTETHRYALVVGANKGIAGEATLGFAVQDAHGVANVLTDIGGFDADNVTVLEGPTDEALRATLLRMRERVQLGNAHGGKTLFVLFYSGHADSTNVHLGGTLMSWHELLKLTDGIPATSRVVVADACRSGEATLEKGLQHFAPFVAARPNDESMPTGTAVLASASAGENSQESPSLHGSFFTYHLVMGLRGAADFNGDGQVTLTEVFQYSADQTAASTVDTMAGVQHATYRYQMHGSGDLVLTRVRDAVGAQMVTLSEPGHYVFKVQDQSGPLALVLQTSKRDQSVWLKRGAYYVQRRSPNHVWAGSIDVDGEHPLTITRQALQPVELALLTSKGGGPDDVTSGLTESDADDALRAPPGQHPTSVAVWGGTGAPLLQAFAMPLYVAIETSERWDRWVLDIQVAYERDVAGHATTINMNQLAIKAGARYILFDGNPFRLSAGLRAGPGYVWQTFPATTVETKQQWFGAADAVLRGEVFVSDHVFFGAEVAAEVALPRTSDTLVRVTPRGTLGVGLNF